MDGASPIGDDKIFLGEDMVGGSTIANCYIPMASTYPGGTGHGSEWQKTSKINETHGHGIYIFLKYKELR